MAFHKRKKNTRMRAKTTHGGGSMKKRRGAGHRGGRGNAGSGKRGDGKKPSYWAREKYMGKFGFTKKNIPVAVISINIRSIEEQLNTWMKAGKVKDENGMIHIDLTSLGFTKLLSTGNATKKLKIIVDYASAKAVEKIKAAGGDIVVANAKE